jgi:phosphopantothenoylcysteine synthetase/decarboxylase
MKDLVGNGGYDAVIHSAAVSDYRVAGVYSPAAGTSFRPSAHTWEGNPPQMEDRAAGKVKSDQPELWLRMVQSPKLIDHVRRDWAFKGVLVKFKLEVGIGEDELLRIAEPSRQQSAADLMVANTLGMAEHFWAYLGPIDGKYQRLLREDLASRLLDEVERLHAGRANG